MITKILISAIIAAITLILPSLLMRLNPNLLGKIFIFIIGAILDIGITIGTMFFITDYFNLDDVNQEDFRWLAGIGAGHLITLWSIVFKKEKKK